MRGDWSAAAFNGSIQRQEKPQKSVGMRTEVTHVTAKEIFHSKKAVNRDAKDDDAAKHAVRKARYRHSPQPRHYVCEGCACV